MGGFVLKFVTTCWLFTAALHVVQMEKHGCMYAGFCRFYQKDGHQCNDEAEAVSFCGTYRVFEDFQVSEKSLFKKLLTP